MHPRIILLEYAMAFVGQPYHWGGDDPINGFDCSGLVIELLKSQGVVERDFDTTAAGLAAKFPATLEPNFGTLALFGPLEKPTHVGFCLTADLMIEAGGGGSATLTREDAARQNAFVRVRPVKSRKDFTSFHQPTYPQWKGV